MKKMASAMLAFGVLGCGLSVSGGAYALEDLKPYYIAIEGSELDLTFYGDDDDDTPSRISDDVKTIRVRGGWNVNDNLSLEAIYGEGSGENVDFGGDSIAIENDQVGGSDAYGPVSGELERITGVYMRYGGFALFDGLKLSGILGYTYRPRVQLNFAGSPDGPFSLDEELDSSLSYGFAATYYIGKSLAFHLDWMHYADQEFSFDVPDNMDDRETSRTIEYRLEGISFGVSLNFGGGEDD